MSGSGPAARGAVFSDGRLSMKEAWTLCQTWCTKYGLEPPPLRTFKWYLSTGVLASELVNNPFGNDPPKISAIREADVRSLVAGFQLRGVLKAPETVSPSTTQPKAPTELETVEAHKYLCDHSQGASRVSLATFREYLAFDVIPGRPSSKNETSVLVSDLDAYLELFPTGIFANHVNYDVGSEYSDLLTIPEAYDYYASKDPYPLTRSTFRGLVDSAIILPVRTTDDVRAPLLGVRRKTIDSFLALQHRISYAASGEDRASHVSEIFADELKKKPSAPPVPWTTSPEPVRAPARIMVPSKPLRPTEPEVRTTVRPLVPLPRPVLPPRSTVVTASPVTRTEIPKEVAPKAPPVARVVTTTSSSQERWAPIKDAFTYYCTKATLPKSFGWFRMVSVPGGIFDVKSVPGQNPTGKRFVVDLDSIDRYLKGIETSQSPKAVVEPSSGEGAIVDYLRRNPGRITAPPAQIPTEDAYGYYCKKVQDPVTKEHFQRLIGSGRIQGAVRLKHVWIVSTQVIDDFIAQFSHKTKGPVRRVQISKRSYANADLLNQALSELAEQGFEVEVVP